MNNLKQSYPEFTKIVDLISAQNPLQKKRIQNYINQQDLDFWQSAEGVCRKLSTTLLLTQYDKLEAARSFNRMSMDFLREQIRFSKTGVYSVDDAIQAQQNVYDRPEIMRYYMVGLLLSYFLWPNHYAMLRFLKRQINKLPKINNYLEIAPGHGLFVSEVLKKFPVVEATLLDISETSLQVTAQVLQAFQVDIERFNIVNADFMNAPVPENSFDFISMGEVLEHVNNPLAFLKKASALLKATGAIFMTTCANCPAIDHVYHFHDVAEIHALIHDAGLAVVDEEALIIDNVPPEGCYKNLVPLNYCAFLKKDEKR